MSLESDVCGSISRMHTAFRERPNIQIMTRVLLFLVEEEELIVCLDTTSMVQFCEMLYTLEDYTDFVVLRLCEKLLHILCHSASSEVLYYVTSILVRICNSPLYGFLCYIPDLHVYLYRILLIHDTKASSLVNDIVKRSGTVLMIHCARHHDQEAIRLFLERVIAHNIEIWQFWPEFVSGLVPGYKAKESMPTLRSCPITLAPMHDPVLASDGHIYERNAILTHLVKSQISPMTRCPLSNEVHSFIDE